MGSRGCEGAELFWLRVNGGASGAVLVGEAGTVMARLREVVLQDGETLESAFQAKSSATGRHERDYETRSLFEGGRKDPKDSWRS